MAFVSGGAGGGGIGGVGSSLPTAAAAATTTTPCGIPSASLRAQDMQSMSPRGVTSSLNAATALAAAQISANQIPAAQLLYQQFLSAGAAAQSQLLQAAAAAAAAATQTAAVPLSQPPILPQAAAVVAASPSAAAAAAAPPQQAAPPPPPPQAQQQQQQAFVLANALAVNQLLLQQNPLQQQVQAALAQLLSPFAYYQPHLTAFLQQQQQQQQQQTQLPATNHVQQQQQQQQSPQIQVQNGIVTPAQQHQKLLENLLVEQVVRNPVVTHDKIGISQPVVADNRSVGMLTTPESVKEHISRLISENEAILEQNPGLIKRRPYHRQVGSQSSIELETGIRSQSSSPGVRDVRLQCTRSHSFYETHKPLTVRAGAGAGGIAGGGPLTNGHPIVKSLDKCCTCNYCELKFANEAALDAHEIRCSKRAEIHSQASAAAAAAVHFQMMQQQQQQQQQQQNLNSNSTTTMENAPASTTVADAGASPSMRKTSTTCSSNVASPTVPHENRHPLKRRLLAAAELLDEQQQQQQHQASTSKTPKLETPKSNVNVASPIGVSQPTAAATSHFKTLIVPQRGAVGPNGSNTTSANPSPLAVVVPATSQSGSGQLALKNVQTFHRVYPTSAAVQCTSAVANKPYILTLSDVSTVRNDGTTRRSRMRNITTETFATLNKPQPMFCEHKPKLSMYSNWQQSTVDSEEAKLNLLYMSTCSTKPRIGVKQLWRYTTALREMGVLKVTHSSFWDYSTKMRLRQNAAAATAAAAAAVAATNSQAVIATFVQERSSAVASTSATVSASNATAVVPFDNGTNNMDEKEVIVVEKGKNVMPASVTDKNRNTFASKEPEENKPNEETGAAASQKVPVSGRKTLSQKIVGGYCTDEVYVYVRGRGRGRYVCDRCGIRCKKPSMLKKHIRSHSDIRPYGCKQCNFNFKTKGNLTKHLQSKTHRRRMAEKKTEEAMEQDTDSDHDRLQIVSPAGSVSTFSSDPLSDDECTSDEEMRPPCDDKNTNIYRKFGQENILVERGAHTPPSLWIVGETKPAWANPDRSRSCHSAPPSARYPSEGPEQQKMHLETSFSLSKDSFEEARKGLSAHIALSSTRTLQLSAASSNCSQMHAISSSSSSLFISEQPSVGAFLAKETMICDICKRAFRSSTEMTLHRKIHLIGPSNSRVRSYQCSECKHSVRSRNALQRHMEERHGIIESVQGGEQNDSDNEDGNASLSSVNPRSFMCTDCNIGFRKHGILAKHLRSKTHVMKLESLRIIPEDSLSLITRKEGGVCLNEIDTTDCERARQSIREIISTLRDSNVLECREQMLQSPAPAPIPTSSSSSSKTSNISLSTHQLRKQRSPIPSTNQTYVENKRLFSAASQQQQQHPTKRHDTVASKTTVELSSKRSDVTILQRKSDDLNVGKSISANVWVPPKTDMINSNSDRRSVDILFSRSATDSAALSDNGSSIRSDEANSEGAGRSESSTPTQRVFLAGTAASPVLPASTRCNVCEVNYESSFDLQVHLHADHVMLRDGKDFCCPKKQCDKVYPNRENLRQHIAAHYHSGSAAGAGTTGGGGGGATPTPEGRDEGEGVITVLSDTCNDSSAAVLHRKLIGAISGQHANSAPNHSPSAPEESHTASCPKAASCSSSSSSLSSADAVVDPSLSFASISNGIVKKRQAVKSNESEKTYGCNGTVDVQNQKRSASVQPITTTSPSSSLSSSGSAAATTTTSVTTAALPCAICGQSFPDAFVLQRHWLSHVCDRPHICKQCDAGFTTADALNTHTLTHQNTASATAATAARQER